MEFRSTLISLGKPLTLPKLQSPLKSGSPSNHLTWLLVSSTGDHPEAPSLAWEHFTSGPSADGPFV